eukprot:TRINITY_DN2055_c0_g1_i1.p1 TRINITY_DN2055_c0_g1~~TRINITY_DN2055_c0_g1_i1.p1  ORF type:complete len:445 (+),score=165.41 TRINITY_DN2055_c0_g1_i1:73-1407(+)
MAEERGRSKSSLRRMRDTVASAATSHAHSVEHFAGKDLTEHGEMEAPLNATEIARTSDAATFMTLLKAFVGPAHLYLAKGFARGGVVLSIIAMFAFAALNAYCVGLLIAVKHATGISDFSEMGTRLFGGYMGRLVDLSLVFAQLGLVAMYFIFVSETVIDALHGLFPNAVSENVSMLYLLAAQLCVQMPLSWLKQIKSISFFAIVADILIFSAMLYIMVQNGIDWAGEANPPTPTVAEPQFPLFFGTAVLIFEGIALMLPIHGAMENTKNFMSLVWGSMMLCCVLFCIFAVLAYQARGGQDVETNLLLLMPETTISNVAKLMYSVAVLFSFPLQAFPAYRIFEQAAGVPVYAVAKKCLLRSCVVLALAAIAYFSRHSLESFVNIIGGLTMCPLAFIFPALFHYKAAAATKFEKTRDLAIFVVGVVAAVGSTALAIKEWVAPSGV